MAQAPFASGTFSPPAGGIRLPAQLQMGHTVSGDMVPSLGSRQGGRIVINAAMGFLGSQTCRFPQRGVRRKGALGDGAVQLDADLGRSSQQRVADWPGTSLRPIIIVRFSCVSWRRWGISIPLGRFPLPPLSLSVVGSRPVLARPPSEFCQ